MRSGVRPTRPVAGRARVVRLRPAPKYRPTLVDPYRGHLRRRRLENPAVPATHLLQEIRELGYTGSSNLLARSIDQGRAEADRPALSPGAWPAVCSPAPTASRATGGNASRPPEPPATR